jgi:hypothetical protein
MSRKQYSLSKQLAVAAALALGTSGVALADDNGMTRFGGDGYAFFHEDKPAANNAPSAFHRTDPRGLSISQYEALSTDGRPWQSPNPNDATAVAAMDAAKAWRRSNPHGLPVSVYETLSADGRPWQLPNRSVASAVASVDAAPDSTSGASERYGPGIARFFGFLNAGSTNSEN